MYVCVYIYIYIYIYIYVIYRYLKGQHTVWVHGAFSPKPHRTLVEPLWYPKP